MVSAASRTLLEPPRSMAKVDSSRRWAAAKTTALNAAAWSGAHDASINSALQMEGPTLRIRSTYEAANNPVVRGVINTHVTDIVGEHGPALSIQLPDATDDDRAWGLAVERAYECWAERPEITGRLSMVDILDLTVASEWTSGDYFIQRTRARNWKHGPSLRLHPIHARRVRTEVASTPAKDRAVIAGVEIDEWGTPLRYWISDTIDDMAYGVSWRANPYDAAEIIHGFRLTEEGQVRGEPILACALEAINELRDYDSVTIDAARNAAMFAVALYTEHPDVEPLLMPSSMKFKRGQASTMPPGWKPANVAPNHPTANYVDCRAERQRDIGLPIGMPGMMVRLDASKHNMASARFDGRIYARGNSKIQGCRERRLLNPTLIELVDELRLLAIADRLDPRLSDADRRALRRQPPRNWYPKWTWPSLPQPDPNKEADADGKRLMQRTTTRADVCAHLSTDYETVATQLDREARLEARLWVDRVLEVQQWCMEHPELGITWRDAFAQSAAEVNPGAFLAAAQKALPPPDDDHEDDAKPARRSAQPAPTGAV